jgi:hypothetical protein
MRGDQERERERERERDSPTERRDGKTQTSQPTNLGFPLVERFPALDDERNAVPPFVVHVEDCYSKSRRDRVIWHLLVVAIAFGSVTSRRSIRIGHILQQAQSGKAEAESSVNECLCG